MYGLRVRREVRMISINGKRNWSRIVGLAFVTGLVACDATQTCTAIGCESGTTINVPITCAPDVLSSLDVRLCLNDECYEGSFTTFSALPPPDAGANMSLENGAQSSANIMVTLYNEGASGYRIRFDWLGEDSRKLKNGDVYRATGTTPLGTVAFDVSRAVTYNESYPNGKDCDDVSCKDVTLTTEAVSCS
jgi:hypothetical protein